VISTNVDFDFNRWTAAPDIGGKEADEALALANTFRFTKIHQTTPSRSNPSGRQPLPDEELAAAMYED